MQERMKTQERKLIEPNTGTEVRGDLHVHTEEIRDKLGDADIVKDIWKLRL
jgi:hypothetical protein